MTEYTEKQAALKAVCDACGIIPDREKENCQYKFAGCKEYYNVFALPPADVRPVVRGRWEWNVDDGHCYCTVCGSVSPESDQHGDECDCPNFCPHCGADMRGGDAVGNEKD